MKAVFARYAAWWQPQPRRQQLMLLAALAVAGLGAIDALLLGPAEKAHKLLRQRIATQASESAERRAQQIVDAAEQKRLRVDEAALRQRLFAAEAALAKARAGLIGPELLRQRLRDLGQDGSVRLLALTTHAAEPATDGARAAKAAARAATLYRMPVTAVVEGPYDALRAHLAALEQAPQGLHWQSVALDNAAWPQLRMELRLVLLSDRAQWRAP